MQISYSLPLIRAWYRMKQDLFQPFNIEKWIFLGFTSFLADLSGFSAGGGTRNVGKLQDFNWDSFLSMPDKFWQFLLHHPFWFALIVVSIVLLALLLVILSWISSRGKFIFLDNVIHNRDEIRAPWHEYRTEGNSLFWWSFFYGWIVLAVVILLFVYGFGIAKNIHLGIISETLKTGFIFGFILTIFISIVIFAYISLFLNDFIVPIMYKHRISALRAWSKFFTLMLHHPGKLFVYGLFIFVLNIAMAIAIIFTSIFTCCIGLIFIIIPIVGSILLLPANYTFRALSVEFLAQFGHRFDVLENRNTFPGQTGK